MCKQTIIYAGTVEGFFDGCYQLSLSSSDFSLQSIMPCNCGKQGIFMPIGYLNLKLLAFISFSIL